MGSKGKMKQLIREIEKVRWVSTEDGWNALLEKNNLPTSPAFLKDAINTFIKKKENKPKGESLLWLRRTLKFTMVKKNGTIKPGRPEEALERFIVASNDEVFNQIPVGGGKENVDLGYWENNAKEVFNFVELKAWKSDESPLYAVIESFKNLSLFRLIQDEKISCRDRKKLKKGEDVVNVHKVKKINLIILAPQKYYEKHKIREGNLPLYKNLIAMLEEKLGITVEFKEINYDETKFNETCVNLAKPFNNGQWTRSKNTEQYDFRKNVNAKDIEVVENLKYKNWIKL